MASTLDSKPISVFGRTSKSVFGHVSGNGRPRLENALAPATDAGPKMDIMKEKNAAPPEGVTLVRIKPKKAGANIRDLAPKKDVKGGGGVKPPPPRG